MLVLLDVGVTVNILITCDDLFFHKPSFSPLSSKYFPLVILPGQELLLQYAFKFMSTGSLLPCIWFKLDACEFASAALEKQSDARALLADPLYSRLGYRNPGHLYTYNCIHIPGHAPLWLACF